MSRGIYAEESEEDGWRGQATAEEDGEERGKVGMDKEGERIRGKRQQK